MITNCYLLLSLIYQLLEMVLLDILFMVKFELFKLNEVLYY